jgi:hypothetical protein
MKAYKGFDKDLRCRGFQYDVGGEYEKQEANICREGFHACENPLDTLRYYRPGDSRYCEVDLEDNGQRESGDSKVCGKKIKIGAEIGLDGVIKAGVRFIFEKCDGATEDYASGESGNAAASGTRGNAAASGERGNAAASGARGNAAASGTRGNAAASGTSGNAAASGTRGNAAASGWSGNAAASGARGNAAASGESGNAAASGERGTATVTGKYGSAKALGDGCLAVAWGPESKAMGKLGAWLVLSEYKGGTIVDARMVRVDGKTINPGIWYMLRNGGIVEVEE